MNDSLLFSRFRPRNVYADRTVWYTVFLAIILFWPTGGQRNGGHRYEQPESALQVQSPFSIYYSTWTAALQ